MFALIDCNSFFASCERVFRPDLQNKPVVVLSNNDGCVVSRSKEAKDLFIPMGAPYFQYREYMKKNDVHVFSSNFSLYGELSHRVMETIQMLCEHVEVYSVDEAFISVENMVDLETELQHIKKTIWQWTRIPVSIGVGSTKTLAKVANHVAKKNPEYNGVCILHKNEIESTLKNFPVREVWGIGRSIGTFLQEQKIQTAWELVQARPAWIQKHLKLLEKRIVSELLGTACLSLEHIHEPKKGIMCTRSFGTPITNFTTLKEAVLTYTSRAAEKLRQEKEHASYISVFIRTNSFNKDPKYSASKGMVIDATSYTPLLVQAAATLLEQIYKDGFRYAKAGVGLLNLTPDQAVQGNLFVKRDTKKEERMMQSLDLLNHKFGRGTIEFFGAGLEKQWKMKSERISPAYLSEIDKVPRVR